jgi:proline dehydrogenase
MAPSRVVWYKYTDFAQNDTIYVIKALKRLNTKATSHKTLCRQVKGAKWVSSRIRAPMMGTESFFEMLLHLIHLTLLSAQILLYLQFVDSYEACRALRSITCTE